MTKEPRLRFTDEERADPALEKPIRKADKAAAKADKAQAKIPKKTVKTRETVVDPATGKKTVRLKFEEVDKKKTPSKLSHAVRDAPANAVTGKIHKEIRETEQDNVGVESAHKSEEAVETGVHLVQEGYRSHKLKPYRKAAQAERRLEKANVNVLYAVCQYFGIQTGENSFGYIASWSKDKELKELRASLETINKTSCELINDIERHYKEICKERGIDLTAQQEQPAAEMDAPMQVPVRHEYKLHDNFERTSPADGTYIQEYTVAEDLSLIPGEVLYTGTYGECAKLYAALQDGSMTAEQVKDQAKMEKLYELDERLYLHIQPCEDGYDYTIYDKDTMRALDGGQLDAPQLPIAKACLEICNLHNIGTHTIAYAPLEMVETLQEAQLSQPTPLPPEPPEHHLDEYPMPDPVLTQDDLEKCGYLDGDLLPLSKERAYELMERDLTVYMIQQGENPEMAFDTADLDAHDGIFAVSREEWEESPEFDKLVKDRMNHQQEREQAFLSHKGDCYAIYQVKHTDELRDIRYEGLEWIKSIGRTVQRDNYDLVYTAPLVPSDLKGSVLDNLEYRFNNEHPADYRHPSMSVSDIVAIKRDGHVSCHYCDSFGFAEVPGFLPDNPLKNAEMTVEDDYGMIDGILNNGQREPTVAQLEQQARSGQPISLMDLAAAAHREDRDKKKSVMEQLKSQPKAEHKKTAPKKSAEREI